jgi:dihydrofolate reductase
MAVWDTLFEDPSVSQFERDFSLVWRRSKKIVVSRSLPAVSTSNTRLVRELPAGEIRRLKAETETDIGVGGPTLAASYLRQGLVDEVGIYYVPVVAGGGTPMFPEVSEALRFALLDERPFDNGVVFVRYRVLG